MSQAGNTRDDEPLLEPNKPTSSSADDPGEDLGGNRTAFKLQDDPRTDDSIIASSQKQAKKPSGSSLTKKVTEIGEVLANTACVWDPVEQTDSNEEPQKPKEDIPSTGATPGNSRDDASPENPKQEGDPDVNIAPSTKRTRLKDDKLTASGGFAKLAMGEVDSAVNQATLGALMSGEMSVSSGAPSSHGDHSRGGGANIVTVLTEDGEEVQLCEFEQDVFSLMFVSEVISPAFVFAFLVFGFQVFILAIIIYDLLQDPPGEEDDNLFNLPLLVDWHVSAAQICALIIVLSSQEEVRTTYMLVMLQYDGNITKEHPGATFWKFALSACCRLISGLLVLFVAFIFIVQSDTVLDIFLDFVAVEFVSGIDNLAFELAAAGFIGDIMENEAKRLEEVRMPVTRLYLKWLPRLMFYGSLALLFFGWATVKARQESGALLSAATCGSFRVDFGDEFYVPPSGLSATFEDSFRANRLRRFNLTSPPTVIYSFFSGDYYQLGTANERSVYMEREIDDPTAGRIYYCSDVLAWVFSIPALGDAVPQATKTGSCPWGYMAKSPTTTSFTLDEAPLEDWKILVGTVLVDAEDLSISCNECDVDADCGLFDGKCNGGDCECPVTAGGTFCTVDLPYCPSLEYIEYGESSLEYLDSGSYKLLTAEDQSSPLMILDHPAYRLPQDAIFGDREEIIMFTGRRWYRTFWLPEERAAVLDSNFHPYWDNVFTLNTYFVSDVTDSDTPISATWNGLLPNSGPIDELTEEVIRTFDVDPYENFDPIVASFKCSSIDCEAELPCGSLGTCSNNTCVCTDFTGGYFCEFAPFSQYSSVQFEVLVEFVNGTFGRYVDNAYHERYWSYQDLGYIDGLI